jgi:hypothetical protein
MNEKKMIEIIKKHGGKAIYEKKTKKFVVAGMVWFNCGEYTVAIKLSEIKSMKEFEKEVKREIKYYKGKNK